MGFQRWEKSLVTGLLGRYPGRLSMLAMKLSILSMEVGVEGKSVGRKRTQTEELQRHLQKVQVGMRNKE